MFWRRDHIGYVELGLNQDEKILKYNNYRKRTCTNWILTSLRIIFLITLVAASFFAGTLFGQDSWKNGFKTEFGMSKTAFVLPRCVFRLQRNGIANGLIHAQVQLRQ
jgi:hypothetical protein